MKRTFIIGVAALAAFGCAEMRQLTARQQKKNPYDKPFYAKYLVTGSPLDVQIQKDLDILRDNPKSAETHNELGTLLVQKGFPKDAEREFERAIDVNGKYYPAWYNLGLVRAARGDEIGASRAFEKTIDLKPGHPAALFQLGLIEEKRQHMDRAVELYAKAYAINPSLLDVQVNPRILDSKLTSIAMLKLYDPEHTRLSMQFQGVPNLPLGARGGATTSQQAPSPQPQPKNILTPAAPPTDPSQHPAASTVAPAQNAPRRPTSTDPAQQQRPNRRRRPTNPAVPEVAPPPPSDH